ncbi:MAG: cytochrome b/b6 domain-containing protein [Pseudomonadota bacterium]|nr:cytochrome b/b6 domain-containing protein [Pseudomonadota bacterium]
MSHVNTPQPRSRWSLAVRLFHWISVLALLVIWALITLHENTDGAGGLYIGLHKALGVCFFFWMLARLTNRVIQKSIQPPPVVASRWQQLSAGLVHSLLYALLLLMPLSGFLMTQFSGRATQMFGWFEIPSLLTPDPDAARWFNQLHTDLIWTAILLLTVAHIGAALYHRLVKKDQTLKRML